MDRMELGALLCNWHSSMGDPIYAVGSFYVSGQVYPDKEIVDNAISSLTSTLEESKRMLAGEKVYVRRNGVQVDLKVFAGYTNEDLVSHRDELEEIIAGLEEMKAEDYT